MVKEESVDDSPVDTPDLPTVKFIINEEKKSNNEGGGEEQEQKETAIEIPKVSHWTKLAKLHRLHILASAASGVPYDPKLLEVNETRKTERKDGEDSDACKVDMHAVSRRQSMLSGHRSADEGDDDDDDDVGAPTASSDTYIKSAIPYLPRRVAIICLILNAFIPGTGTMLSGLSVFCCGQPRIKEKDGVYASTLCVNLLVGVMQLFTITFLLVGWIWSLVWGIYMVLLAVEQSNREKAKQKTELKVRTLTALNSRLRAWSLRQTR